jgi:hypothetical protein
MRKPWRPSFTRLVTSSERVRGGGPCASDGPLGGSETTQSCLPQAVSEDNAGLLMYPRYELHSSVSICASSSSMPQTLRRISTVATAASITSVAWGFSVFMLRLSAPIGWT